MSEWKARFKRAASMGIAGVALLSAVALALVLSILYFLVRFIHWAWIR
jgi:hypothetical protein